MKKILSLLLLFLVACGAKAQYNSLLWKISGNGLKQPSYLFGTMHTSDARVFTHVQNSMPAFERTKAYAMELDPDKIMDAGILSKVMMGKDYSLQKMLPKAEYDFLDSLAVSQVGYPMALFDNVVPVFIMTILESIQMGLVDSSIAGNNNQDVMDLYLFNEAKKAKKKIIGIETVDEQLSALNSLSYQEQADLLVESVRSFQKKDKEEKDILQYYISQNLDSLASGQDEMPAVFYKAVVTDRNERMANRIAEFIKKQPTYIAIGALHLAGEKGVVELLRKQGFTVKAEKN